MPALLRSTLLLVTALFALPAFANDATRYNQVSLRAEVSQEVSHDLMQVTLYHEAQNADAQVLSQHITQTLNSALQKAREVKDVTVSQGARHSYPVYDEKNQTIIAWRERAEVRLESADFSALASLTGELLGDLKMATMDFSLSKSLRAQHEDALLDEAIKAFNARATRISKALGGKSFKLVSMNIDSAGFHPMSRMQSAAPAMAKMMDTPEIEAGASNVNVTLNGVIEVLH